MLDFDMILPLHNEASTIEQVVDELFQELRPRFKFQLLLCEDGSTDGTQTNLKRIHDKYSVSLVQSEFRTSYTEAIKRGLRTATAPYVLIMDADGQYNPRDLLMMWENRSPSQPVWGCRISRRDPLYRRVMSFIFCRIYRLFFRTRLRDPSCGLILIHRSMAAKYTSQMGLMEIGFGWELAARLWRDGVHCTEVPIHHRPRLMGSSRAFAGTRLPRLVVQQLTALARLWAEGLN